MEVIEALERVAKRQLRKPPPYTEEDLASLISIVFDDGEGAPAGIERLPNLAPKLIGIRYRCWSAPDLSVLPQVPHLFTLKCKDCSLTSIEVLRQCPGLDTLEIPRCQVTDLTPLLDAPRLRFLDPGGNPLDERSFREVLPYLREKGVRFNPKYDLHEREWRIMRRLHERGIACSAFHDVYGETRISKPGKGHDFTKLAAISEEEVYAILDAEPQLDTDGFMERARAVQRERLRRRRGRGGRG